ncbi:RidA family protein [Candidatus Bathyarchaeota archaeon]|nr:MAG: RidA family protein [Candidatus Bathyarchaeota archaeon]
MSKEYYTKPGMEKYPFSSAVKAGDYIFISGTATNEDEQGNKLTTIETQTHEIMKQFKNALAQFDATMDDIVKVSVYIGEQAKWGNMNEVYRSYFGDKLPARVTCVAGLVIPGFLVEMDCIAYKP